MTRRLVVLAFTWVGFFALGLSGQQGQPSQSPPVFRGNVDAVELDVFVTDRQGNPVTDLTAADFQIEEDEVRQNITSFSLVDIPMQAGPSASGAEPDVQTNTRPLGRLYVFAIDNLGAALRARHHLRRFVEDHFGPNDVGALVYLTIGQARNTQDFTGNPRLLLRAIDNIMPGDGGQIIESRPMLISTTQPNYLGGPRTRMESLRALTESLAQIRGRRKVVFYVTEGLGMDVFDALDHHGGTKSIAFDDMHAALSAATRGNIAIYPVDPSGLTGELALSESVDLRAMADATGAEAIVNTNSIRTGLGRIVRDNSSYYVIGYASTNDRREGRFRDVDVRVSRPGLTVRTRSGYLEPQRKAPKPATTTIAALPTALAKALEQPLADSAVPMTVFATPYRTGDRRASVLIAQEFDASALGVTQTADVAGAIVAVSADGKIYGGKYEFRPVTVSSAGGNRVRLVSEIQVPSGRYQLRVAGGTKDRAGSVMYDLEVPEYRKTPLALSGLALTVPADAATVDLSTRARTLPGSVTTRREFSASETLTLYTEAYDNVREAPAHSVDLTIELRTADGRVVRTVAQQRSSTELSGGMNGFTVALPLNGATAGNHILHVEARANVAEPVAVSQSVPIRIR